jgi:hypothetical protein
MSGCPFECGWTTEDTDPRAVAVHLRVEHGADIERDVEAWERYVSIDAYTVEYVGTLDSPPFRFSWEGES